MLDFVHNLVDVKRLFFLGGLVAKSCQTLVISWTVARQAPLSMGFFCVAYAALGFLGGASDKEPVCPCRRLDRWVRSLGGEDLLEKGMAIHSGIIAE